MTEPAHHRETRERLIDAAAADRRIVGLISDGSWNRDQVDRWSDIDVSVFVRDDDFDEFFRNWKRWAGQFGHLLLAYISWVGYPWTVYDAEPVPLRVDFDLHRSSTIDQVRHWPVSTASVDRMVWYDGTGGILTAAVENLVGRSLRPPDLAFAFEQTSGDLWYDTLFTYSKLRRGEHWVARQAYHQRVMEPLIRLLRIEAGAVDRWEASPTAADLEDGISCGRLTELAECVPGPTDADLSQALLRSAHLGRAVCESIGTDQDWSWPDDLARRVIRLLDDET